MIRKLVGTATLIFVAAAAQAEERVVAALGDSLTQGFGLPEADGFVPQLETWLRDQGYDISLINAGVSGDTTAGGLSRIGWTLTPDVDALIVALGGNDVLRGIDPAASRNNLSGVLAAATEASVPVLLVGMTAPNNYGPDYKVAFDAIYPELAAEYGTLYAESFFTGLGADGDLSKARALMQADGVHPNAEGVRLIVEDLGPHVAKLLDTAGSDP
ncbi:MAG: arylesterase [Pseudomonadota bacterium]